MVVEVMDVKWDVSEIGIDAKDELNKIPECYVKIKKIDVAPSFVKELNSIRAAVKAENCSSTTTISLLAKPSTEVQAPLTAFFLPTASSDHTVTSVDSAEHVPGGNCSGRLGTVAEDILTSKSIGENLDNRKVDPSTNAPPHQSLFPSRPSPAAGLPSQSRARPANVQPRLARFSSRSTLPRARTLETHPGHLYGRMKHPVVKTIPVDSSDLPEGWRRLKVPRRRKHSITGHDLSRTRYDLLILTPEPCTTKLRAQKEVDAYIEKNGLNLSIKFRPWQTQDSRRTSLPGIPPPSQPLPVNIPSGTFHPGLCSPARLLPKNATNSNTNRPVNSAATPILCSSVTSIPRSPVTSFTGSPVPYIPRSPVTSIPRSPVASIPHPPVTIPRSPDLPLPTLAKALASLGGNEEGSRKLVLFHLTDQQIQAFNTLGVKEVGIVE